MMTDEQIKNLSPGRRDFLEIWGNQWAPAKVRPGTCEACVYNQGAHAEDCVVLVAARLRRDVARESFLDAAYDLNQRGIL